MNPGQARARRQAEHPAKACVCDGDICENDAEACAGCEVYVATCTMVGELCDPCADARLGGRS